MRTAVEVSNEVTVAGGGFTEATAAVIPPNTNRFCRQGRLFFGSGSNVLSLNLDGQNNAPTATAFADRVKTPEDLSDPWLIFDNHLVATKDGRLFYSFESVIWRDNIEPRPTWWEQTKDNTLKTKNVPGGRGAIFVFASSDCGTTWSQRTVIDAADLTVTNPVTKQPEKGYCGFPRVDSGAKTAEAGGWDGHYLYADPNHNHLYITTVCANGKANWLGLVLMTRTDGITWSTHRQVTDAGFWRTPITALSNSRVGFVYAQGNKAFFETFGFPGKPEDFQLKKEVAPLSYPSDVDTDTDKMSTRVGLNASMYAYPTMSRAETRAKPFNLLKRRFLLAAYNNKDKAATYNLFEFDSDQPAKLFATVEAEKPGRSVLQGTFVEAVGENAPSIFYWLEEIETGKFQVRFRIFSNGKQFGGTRTISETFSTPTFTGDYLHGTSYKTGDGWEFFLSWSESGELKFVNVFVPSTLEKAKPLFASVNAKIKVNSPPKIVVPTGAASELRRKSRQR
jgi:hypothetical protein